MILLQPLYLSVLWNICHEMMTLEENMRKGQKVIYFHNLFVAIKNLCDLN